MATIAKETQDFVDGKIAEATKERDKLMQQLKALTKKHADAAARCDEIRQMGVALRAAQSLTTKVGTISLKEIGPKPAPGVYSAVSPEGVVTPVEVDDDGQAQYIPRRNTIVGMAAALHSAGWVFCESINTALDK